MKTRIAIMPALVAAAFGFGMGLTPATRAWGPYGHEISARAAALALPAEMPAFFRDAVGQLAYLNPEPDRWRDGRESALDPAMNAAHAPEHYLNFETVPEGALESENRFEFLRAVGAGPMPGLAPYRILELFQRLRVEFRLWREEDDPRIRGWIEQRIIDDAGILGHYVTDVANPLHTTVHFDGWTGPNPNRYATRDSGIHARFETEYVGARLTLEDLRPLMRAPVRVHEDPRRAILDHIRASHALVEPLYGMDRDVPFDQSNGSAAHRDFTLRRLAVGALMLRDLWWTAWRTS